MKPSKAQNKPTQEEFLAKMRKARAAATANTYLETIKHSLAIKGILLPDDFSPYEENPEKLKEILNEHDFEIVSKYLKIWNDHLKPLYEGLQKKERE